MRMVHQTMGWLLMRKVHQTMGDAMVAEIQLEEDPQV
jgi:hypothetical protein